MDRGVLSQTEELGCARVGAFKTPYVALFLAE
jgi:hypothetical protein